MEQVRLSDLGKIFVDEDSKGSVLRPRVSSRGYLLVCDDEAVRDSAVNYLKRIDYFRYLDFNAEPQGKHISEMVMQIYGVRYYDQKRRGYEVSLLAPKCCGDSLVVDNFQDIGLLIVREVKLALAFLRSLGREPYSITVIGVGSLESLDIIKLDRQLNAAWTTYELVGDSIKQE